MGPTRPSSAMFGYPPINVHGTLPPVPLPRLQAPPRPRQRSQPDPDSSDSEPQDKDRADLIPQSSGFQVPRPKSRSSLAVCEIYFYGIRYIDKSIKSSDIIKRRVRSGKTFSLNFLISREK